MEASPFSFAESTHTGCVSRRSFCKLRSPHSGTSPERSKRHCCRGAAGLHADGAHQAFAAEFQQGAHQALAAGLEQGISRLYEERERASGPELGINMSQLSRNKSKFGLLPPQPFTLEEDSQQPNFLETI